MKKILLSLLLTVSFLFSSEDKSNINDISSFVELYNTVLQLYNYDDTEIQNLNILLLDINYNSKKDLEYFAGVIQESYLNLKF